MWSFLMIAPDTLQSLYSYPAPSVQPDLIIGAPVCFGTIADSDKMASLRLNLIAHETKARRFTLLGFSCRSFLLRGRRNDSVSSGVALVAFIAFFTLFALRPRRAGGTGRSRRAFEAPRKG